jgi:glutathione S-transferase
VHTIESSFIIEYLELSHPRLRPDAIEQRLLHRRIEVLADGLCDALVLILIERTREHCRQSELWVDRQRGKADRALAEITRLIARGSEFATGDAFGLGDIALGCTLGYLDLRFPQVDWRAQHSHLLPLYNHLSQRESFKITKPEIQTFRDQVA